MTARPIKVLQFARCPLCGVVGGRPALIQPTDPEYLELQAQNEESAAVLVAHIFARDALRGFWPMLWAQLTGAA